MNTVVLGIRCVIVLSNQCVSGMVDAYPVVVLIDCLWNKRLIPPKIPQAPRLRDG